uniref:Putative secreted peptide n=1 Tax=Anopheles braziliensis TaxID=58242 RepID=A0A2M3ZUR2_9DIPT
MRVVFFLFSNNLWYLVPLLFSVFSLSLSCVSTANLGCGHSRNRTTGDTGHTLPGERVLRLLLGPQALL